MLDYHMNTFLTLCQQMNYRKTAEVLNLTQPAITQHIQYLETYYGCKLFIYDKKKLSMTKEAEILQRHAQNLEYQEQALLKRLAAPEKISMKIGATKTIGEYVIADDICRLIKKQEFDISVVVDNTAVLLKKLDAGLLDLALIEGYYDNTKYASQCFKKEKFVGICGNMHPFAGKTVELTDCIKERLIVREEGSGTRQIFEHVLSEHNFSLENFQDKSCIDDIGLIVGLLEKNCGITFAYRSIAENNSKLATFFLQNEDMQHDFSIVYLDNQYAKDKVLAFLQAEE